MSRSRRWMAATRLVALTLVAGAPAAAAVPPAASGGGADGIAAAIAEPELRGLVEEVLRRNPAVAAARHRAAAAAQRAPQVRSLPDPTASLTAYLATPETRVGPQRLMAGVSQALPGFGKRALKEQAALYEAAALEAEVEGVRLELVTETRRLCFELAFLDRHRRITETFRDHLLQHEEISRARYSTGVGPGQGVIKLQAEITRVDRSLLEIETRRSAVAAQLNALRDRPASEPLACEAPPTSPAPSLEPERLLERALASRPELAAAELRVRRAETLVRLAEKGYRPDFQIGLLYTLVDRRDDRMGRLSPPDGDGDDVIGLQGGITLPVRRARLAAAVVEAEALESAAVEAGRDLTARVSASIGELTQRIPLAWQQLSLVRDLLVVQAEEALESAKSGYIAGTLNALDLLDAEHVMFEAETAAARAAADYRIALARLEGAVGTTLSSLNPPPQVTP